MSSKNVSAEVSCSKARAFTMLTCSARVALGLAAEPGPFWNCDSGMDGVKSHTILFAILLVCFFSACSARHLQLQNSREKFNLTLARVLVDYASAVYIDDPAALWAWSCDRCEGHTKGFELVELIMDVKHCLEAFVGVDKNLGAIIIAFRGTQENSIQNWAEDLYFRQLDFNYPGCTDSMVHHGFYSAYHNTSLRPLVVGAVQKILKERPELKIMVTGHSMGGAMATFSALDLVVNYGLKNIQVVTFGQPRVGNPAFADYYNSLVPNTIRMTHGHDMVPHLPPYYPVLHDRTYHHIATEVWVYDYGIGILSYEVFRVCDSSGEDSSCSRSVVGNSVSDHLMYLGVFLKAESPAAQLSSS